MPRAERDASRVARPNRLPSHGAPNRPRGVNSSDTLPWNRLAAPAFAAFALAIAVRGIYIAEYARDPTFDLALLDQLYNDDLARRILSDGAPAQPWFRPPGYVWFLAALRSLFPEGFVGIRVVQAIIGSCSAALVALLAGRLFGRPAAWIAGMVMALCGSLVVADAELLSPVLVVPLNAAMLLALGEAARGGGWRWWCGAGAAAGASAVVRPDMLPFIPVAAVGAVLLASDRRRAIAGAACFCGLAGAAILPVAVRNRAVGGEWVLVAANGGVNFYIGNNPESDGRSVALPGRTQWGGGWEDTRAMAEREAGRPLSWSEASSHYFAKGIGSWREQPGAMAKLALRKLWYFGHGLEILNSRDDYTSRHFSVVARILMWPLPPHLPWGILGPLAMGAMVWAWRRGGPSRLLVLYVAVYWMVVSAFFVTGRFRLPAIPAAAVLAAGFLAAFAAEARASTIPKAFLSKSFRVPGIVGGIALVAFNVPQDTGSWQPGARAQYAYAAGTALQNESRGDEAIPLLEEAWRADPLLDDAALFLADAHRSRGDFAAAEKVYAALLAKHPGNASMHTWMGETLAMQGRGDEALASLQRAVDIDPSLFDARMGVAMILLQSGADVADARVHLEAADALKDDPRCKHLLATIAAAEGRTADAVRYYEEAIALDPSNERARAGLAEVRAAVQRQ